MTTVFAAKSAAQVPLVADPVSTQLMPMGVLVITPPPADPAPAVTVRRCGAAVKAAVTTLVMLLATATAQVPPVQAPLKPSKLAFAVPPATRVTVPPTSNEALQMPLVTPAVTVHEIPDGELVTAPVPVPTPLTVTIPGGGIRYVISATRGRASDIWHGLPMQSPPQPCRMLMPRATCESVTAVFIGNARLQTPEMVPSATRQLMPAGRLVMVPLPRDVGDGLTVSIAGTSAGGGGGGVGAEGGVGAGDGTNGRRKVASTVRCPFIVTVHGSPMQLVPHA